MTLMEKSKGIPLALLLALVVCCGCAAKQPMSVSVPAWVNGEPKVEGMICAVGVSESTYFAEDAIETAARNGRAELARTISVTIKSVMLDVSSDRRSFTDEANVQQVQLSDVEAVLNQSKTIETWFDEAGAASLGKSMTYALVCMDRDKCRLNSVR